MDRHLFCRALLRNTMEEVRERVKPKERKKAWAWRSGKHVEFHGPNNFFWHGRGCCLWYAKSEGWSAYLRSHGRSE